MKHYCERTCGYRGYQIGFEKCYREPAKQCLEDIDPQCENGGLNQCLSSSPVFEYSKCNKKYLEINRNFEFFK
jgi:hypothetical protein